MFKRVKNEQGQNNTDLILRIADNANIPNDAGNKDWIVYQAWLIEADQQGNSLNNQPLSAD